MFMIFQIGFLSILVVHILKGVEANKHYQNPKLYPDPPTDIFKANHVHDSRCMYENYVVKNNDEVKLVGYIQ